MSSDSASQISDSQENRCRRHSPGQLGTLSRRRRQKRDFSAGGFTRSTARAEKIDMASMNTRILIDEPPSSRSDMPCRGVTGLCIIS